MNRYIDADALIEYLKKMWGKWDEDDWYEAQSKTPVGVAEAMAEQWGCME